MCCLHVRGMCLLLLLWGVRPCAWWWSWADCVLSVFCPLVLSVAETWVELSTVTVHLCVSPCSLVRSCFVCWSQFKSEKWTCFTKLFRGLNTAARKLTSLKLCFLPAAPLSAFLALSRLILLTVPWSFRAEGGHVTYPSSHRALSLASVGWTPPQDPSPSCRMGALCQVWCPVTSQWQRQVIAFNIMLV